MFLRSPVLLRLAGPSTQQKRRDLSEKKHAASKDAHRGRLAVRGDPLLHGRLRLVLPGVRGLPHRRRGRWLRRRPLRGGPFVGPSFVGPAGHVAARVGRSGLLLASISFKHVCGRGSNPLVVGALRFFVLAALPREGGYGTRCVHPHLSCVLLSANCDTSLSLSFDRQSPIPPLFLFSMSA